MNCFTIKEKSNGYVELLKSKFYSYAIPVSDVEQFKTILEAIRKDNPKAKHVVYAYRIGLQLVSRHADRVRRVRHRLDHLVLRCRFRFLGPAA